jgi:hypothetical protein
VRVKALGGHERGFEPGQKVPPELTRARVQALEEFVWSSYRFLAGIQSVPNWLETSAILECFGSGPKRRRQAAFREHMQRAAALGQWETSWKERVKYMVLLGSETFVAQARQALRGDPDQQTGLRQASRGALGWEQIEQAVAKAWNQPWAELRRTRGSGAREAALFLGRTQGRFTLRELGRLVGGVKPNAVSIALSRFRTRLEQDRMLARRFAQVQKILKAK